MEKRVITGINLIAWMRKDGVNVEMTYENGRVIGTYVESDFAKASRDAFFSDKELKDYFYELKFVRDERSKLEKMNNSKGADCNETTRRGMERR